ncbi:MAG TPA: type II toxin-antitoxin system VapC family toxin [Thermoleophilaceae bacterium]
MIVVDASIIVSALSDDGSDGERIRTRLMGETLVAPELLDVEVLSVWRRHVRGGMLPAKRAEQALGDLAVLPLRRVPHQPLLHRVWELRDDLTAYDATYVALAEALETSLLTADEALSRSAGPQCEILLFR